MSKSIFTPEPARNRHASATVTPAAIPARTLEKLIPRTLQKAHSKNIAKSSFQEHCNISS